LNNPFTLFLWYSVADEEDEEDLQLPHGQINSDEGRRLRDQLVQNVFALQ
jgi:hypothetical protein